MTATLDHIPHMARALLQKDPASRDLVLEQLPVPKRQPNSNEHLIRVYAIAPCNGELLWPKNFPLPDPSIKYPVPGYDMAGTVVEAPESSPFQPGSEVYGRTRYSRTGAARDYTISVTAELARRSQRLSWAESAATALSAESAWQALFIQAGLGDIESGLAEGKRILITGASGGCGCWEVQLASLAGAHVIGICGGQNVDLVKKLGAKETIDYHTTDIAEWGQKAENKVDIVIDNIGGPSLEGSWWAAKGDGVIVSIAQPPETARPLECENYVKTLFFIMQSSGAQLEQITKLIDEGKCKPLVDSVWSLEDHKKAFDKADSGHASGKVVIDIIGSARHEK